MQINCQKWGLRILIRTLLTRFIFYVLILEHYWKYKIPFFHQNMWDLDKPKPCLFSLTFCVVHVAHEVELFKGEYIET